VIPSLLAIDPGAKGGFAWRDGGHGGAGCQNMPDTELGIMDRLSEFRMSIRHCYIEEISGFIPAGGAGQMFHFGYHVGYLRGILDTLRFKITTVRPQVWQKALGLGNVGTQRCHQGMSAKDRKAVKVLNDRLKREWKRKLRDTARRMYPELGDSVTLSTCDALLILQYAIKQPL
jgi:hypothetical protein